MPTYDFKCIDCATTFNVVQGINAKAPHPKCAHCKKPMTRIYSAPPVTFKGNGWGKDRN